MAWEDSYVGQIRKLVGHRSVIMPGPRAFVTNGGGRTLFIQRRGDSSWALPGGTIELGETVFEALQREVNEETGIDVISATLVAIYSGSKVAGVDRRQNEYQLLVFQFRVDEWAGSLVTETDELVDAGFFSQDELPEAYGQYHQAFADLDSYSGSVILG